MNCRSAESLFSALIEDELSQKERRFLEAHLLSCRKCSVSLKETRAAMELFLNLPMEETSPHFEQDVMIRIRSGEGLRPSLIEWARSLLAPAWLRPAAVATAGACAVWIAAFLGGPMIDRYKDGGSAPVATIETPAPASAPQGDAPATVAPEAPALSVAEGPTATPSAAGRTAAAPAPARSRVEQPAGLASASRETPAPAFKNGEEASSPGAGYVDEYITDQFYLERGNGGSVTPGITPVSDRPSDDVYIVF